MDSKLQIKTANLNKIAKFVRIILIATLIIFPGAYLLFTLHLPPKIAKLYIEQVELNYLIILGCGLITAFLFIYPYSKRHGMSKEEKTLIYLFLIPIIVIYAGYLFLFSLGRYISFASEAIDVPYFHYAVLQLSHFQIPLIWDNPARFVWADHFSPILILFVPFYWLLPSPTLLMALEIGVVLLGAIPLYFASFEVLRSKFLSLALVIAYLTFGGLQMGYAYGFHEIVLFPTFFFLAYYFFVKKKKWLYIIFILLTLSIKEEVSFTIIFWGIYLLIFNKNKIYALITATLGTIWYILSFYIVIPYFNNGNMFGYWGQYKGGSGGIVGIIGSSLMHPITFFSTLINPSYKIDTIFHTFTPFAFLPILYPPSLLIIVPSLMEKLLSNGLASYSGYHYSAAIAGVTLVAVIETLNFITNKSFWKRFMPHKMAFLGILIIYCSVASNILYGYYPLSPFFTFFDNTHTLSDAELTTLQSAIDIIPKSASVSAHAVIIPHLEKPMGMIKHGPVFNDKSDYVIWDDSISDYFVDNKIRSIFQSLVSSGRYEIIVMDNHVILLKRVK